MSFEPARFKIIPTIIAQTGDAVVARVLLPQGACLVLDLVEPGEGLSPELFEMRYWVGGWRADDTHGFGMYMSAMWVTVYISPDSDARLVEVTLLVNERWEHFQQVEPEVDCSLYAVGCFWTVKYDSTKETFDTEPIPQPTSEKEYERSVQKVIDEDIKTWSSATDQAVTPAKYEASWYARAICIENHPNWKYVKRAMPLALQEIKTLLWEGL